MNDFIIYTIVTTVSIIPVIILYFHFMKKLKDIKRKNGFRNMDHFLYKGEDVSYYQSSTTKSSNTKKGIM